MKEGDELDFKVLDDKDNVMHLDIELEDGTVLRVMVSIINVKYMGTPDMSGAPNYSISSQLSVLPLKIKKMLKLKGDDV